MFTVPRVRERVDPLLAFLLLILVAILAYDYAIFPIRIYLHRIPAADRPDVYRAHLDIHIDYRRGSIRIPGNHPSWVLSSSGRPLVVLYTVWSRSRADYP